MESEIKSEIDLLGPSPAHPQEKHSMRGNEMLNEQIKSILGTRTDQPCRKEFDLAYHQNFQESGLRKAKEIVNDISSRSDLDPAKCAYFSIGGSTGVELAHVLINTPISYGILLEHNPAATDIAQEQKRELQKLGKTLVIITGDAYHQLDLCKDQFIEWRKSGAIEGMVVSLQAVLHELPKRSPNFDLNHFVGELTWDWDPFLLFSREPCEPSGWPDNVEIHVPTIESSILESLANEIRVTLQLDGPVLRAGPDYVSMPQALAAETLMKIFYLEDYNHEIEEQVTSLNPLEFITILEKYLGPNSTSLTMLSTQSFTQKYRDLGVSGRKSPLGDNLPIPLTFARIIAERVNGANS